MKSIEKPDSEMQPEYDLSEKKGTRGKYAKAYKKGHSVRMVTSLSATSISQPSNPMFVNIFRIQSLSTMHLEN